MAEVTEGEGEAKRTYSKVTFTAANVVNNKGTELRPPRRSRRGVLRDRAGARRRERGRGRSIKNPPSATRSPRL
ncbi:MAG: hypothetical protein ACLSDQ_05070 [Adlercreutzia equolifaciens]